MIEIEMLTDVLVSLGEQDGGIRPARDVRNAIWCDMIHYSINQVESGGSS